MDKITKYIQSNNFGELEASIKHFNGKPRITLNYILKSNSKRQRKLKVLTILKEEQWFKLNSILKISKNKYQKVIEIHEDEFDTLIANIEYIIKLFFETKRWFVSIVEFHNVKFSDSMKIFNDLDFIYGNEDISYRFSLNPGGLLVRVKVLNYSKDTIELLQYISENCNMYGGTCIIENNNENNNDIFTRIEGYIEPKKKRIELSDEESKITI
ncbi:MAG: hypothetical protein MJ191_07045 [Clostridium sp.]|nr:hypothetical protein [Clostridium sp.]